MADINRFALENSIKIELGEIIDVLDQTEKVYLYDTAAISRHKLVFAQHGKLLLKEILTGNEPIILTDTIVHEMLPNEESYSLYGDYFKNFSNVLILKENDFFNLLNENFHPKQKAEAKFKNCSVKAFSTISQLKNDVYSLKSNISNNILNLFNQYLPDKNRGEYSLLWLSTILECIYPTLNISFVGFDMDLYEIVYHCHLKEIQLRELLASQGNIDILSSETILQALIRDNNIEAETLCELFHDDGRYSIFHEINNGIRSLKPKRDKITVEDFFEKITENKVDIVY